MPIFQQILWLGLLGMPVACISWTVTHEEVFREPRDYCLNQSLHSKSLVVKKFFYLFTCEYCFSHYVSILVICLAGFKLLLGDWRGYVLSGFSLVWVSNIYMSLFGLIRLDIRKDRTDIQSHSVK